MGTPQQSMALPRCKARTRVGTSLLEAISGGGQGLLEAISGSACPSMTQHVWEIDFNPSIAALST